MLVPGLRREGFGQGGPPSGDPAANGTGREVEHSGDLGVVEIGDVTKHDRKTVLVAERAQSGVERQMIADGVDSSAAGRIGVLDVMVVDLVGRGEHTAALAAAQLVEAGVGGDAVGPRAERRTPVETGEVAHNGDHRILGCVGGVGFVPGDASTHSVHAVVVTAEQLVECPTVSPLGCSHQLVVGELRRDSGETTAASPSAAATSFGRGECQAGTKLISEMSPRYGFLVHSGVLANCLNRTST